VKNTGKEYEELVEDALLNKSNSLFERQVFIGIKPNKKTKHYVDILLIEKDEVVSLKYQGCSGTAEEKIPYEVLVLQHQINEGKCKTATIVLGGDGWTQMDWYLEEGFCDKMNCPNVNIITHDTFMKEYTTVDSPLSRGLEGLFA
jgi:hypothetical protein